MNVDMSVSEAAALAFTIVVYAVAIIVGGVYAYRRNPKRLAMDDEDQIEVPALEVLLADPGARDTLRAQITLIGFLHNNGQSQPGSKRLFSEIYVVRLDGIPQTIHTRSRSIEAYSDDEGEALAKGLADELGLELEVG
jgi:hypothetical protein